VCCLVIRECLRRVAVGSKGAMRETLIVGAASRDKAHPDARLFAGWVQR
jgi:hypothetical protein